LWPAAAATPGSSLLRLSPRLALASWEQLEPLRQQASAAAAEGLMLKALESPYLAGRKRGHWWKHKRDPYTLDAVLLYAQAGSGRRANLFTDYTFGLWDRSPADPGQPAQLVSFAKAYSGLDDGEITALDRWIRQHTSERFGPVRAVQPEQVFELAFEGLQRSPRHKSGLAVRFPRIRRWRHDKPASEADTLASALALLQT
jgi:DNA ligase-1